VHEGLCDGGGNAVRVYLAHDEGNEWDRGEPTRTMNTIPSAFRGLRLPASGQRTNTVLWIAFVALGLILSLVLIERPSLAMPVVPIATVALLAFLKFDWFMVAWVFLVPLQQAYPRTSVAIWCSLPVILVIRDVARRRSSFLKLLKHPILRAGFLYLAMVSVSMVLHPPLSIHGLNALVKVLTSICACLAIVYWADREDRLRAACSAFLASLILVAAVGIYQVVLGDLGDFYYGLFPRAAPWAREPSFMTWSGRAVSVLDSAGGLAGYVNLIIPLGLAYGLAGSTYTMRWVGSVTLFLGAATLFFTFSRGAFLGLGVMLLFGAFLWRKRSSLSLKIQAGIAGIGTIAVMAPYISERVLTMLPEERFARLELFRAAWQMFLSSPVVGLGYGNFTAIYYKVTSGPLASEGWNAHNLFLQHLAETGALGFVAYLILLGTGLLHAYRLMRQTGGYRVIVGLWALLALAGTIPHDFVNCLLTYCLPFSTTFWIILACVIVAGRLQVSHAAASSGPAMLSSASRPASPVEMQGRQARGRIVQH